MDVLHCALRLVVNRCEIWGLRPREATTGKSVTSATPFSFGIIGLGLGLGIPTLIVTAVGVYIQYLTFKQGAERGPNREDGGRESIPSSFLGSQRINIFNIYQRLTTPREHDS